MRKIFLYTLMIVVGMTSLNAQVVINEYSASNLESFTDSFGKTEDWIELYNTSNSTVNIGGWHLSDKESKPEKWEIPTGTMIPGNSFMVFYCSGRDGFLNAEFHTNFKLAQTTGKDIVLLSDATGNIQEMHSMELTLVEHSRCRTSLYIGWYQSKNEFS